VGIANEDSIAYGCAKAFQAVGADVAVTYLNEKAKPHVETLAQALGASILHCWMSLSQVSWTPFSSGSKKTAARSTL
jgi:enoyl-[acyl-carrier-protein] reductase (NADH)